MVIRPSAYSGWGGWLRLLPIYHKARRSAAWGEGENGSVGWGVSAFFEILGLPQLHESFCVLMSSTLRCIQSLLYCFSWGALSGVSMPVTDHCTESGVRKYFRLGSVRETRAWCDHKVWFAYSPPCTLKAPEREACTLKTPEREASPGSHTGQAVGCVSHLSIHLSVFLTTRSLSVSCHWHMDVWSARIHPLFNFQLLEKLPGVLTQRIQPAQM